MSVDAVLNASKGLIVAPAGCGKTHLITEALGFAQSKPYLVLTHTTAGVTALKKRLSRFAIPPRNYVVTTIDGWALKIAGCFPGLCPLGVGPENPTVFTLLFAVPYGIWLLTVILAKSSQLLIRVCWSMNTGLQ